MIVCLCVVLLRLVKIVCACRVSIAIIIITHHITSQHHKCHKCALACWCAACVHVFCSLCECECECVFCIFLTGTACFTGLLCGFWGGGEGNAAVVVVVVVHSTSVMCLCVCVPEMLLTGLLLFLLLCLTVCAVQRSVRSMFAIHRVHLFVRVSLCRGVFQYICIGYCCGIVAIIALRVAGCDLTTTWMRILLLLLLLLGQ